MAVEWFDKQPGSDIGQSQDDPSMLLMNVGKPDWVNVPEGTGYPGRYRCLELRVGKCPVPGHDHDCIHYILDGPVWCAECEVSAMFQWYRARV
jgi:hypothetical protein